MRKTSFAIGAAVALVFSAGVGGVALADDSAKAHMTGTTKPNMGKGPADEKSLPSSAAPASRAGTTGSTGQSATVNTMNKDEKTKVDAAGK